MESKLFISARNVVRYEYPIRSKRVEMKNEKEKMDPMSQMQRLEYNRIG